jgi:hypothetical protein
MVGAVVGGALGAEMSDRYSEYRKVRVGSRRGVCRSGRGALTRTVAAI